MAQKQLHVVINDVQDKILEAKAQGAGFKSKSEYVRYLLFMEMTAVDKINKIYEKVVENDK